MLFLVKYLMFIQNTVPVTFYEFHIFKLKRLFLICDNSYKIRAYLILGGEIPCHQVVVVQVITENNVKLVFETNKVYQR